MTEEEHPPFDLMSRPNRILFLARDLLTDLDNTVLEEIDGEFYWRLCQGDALDRMKDLMRKSEAGDMPKDMTPKAFILRNMGDPQPSSGFLEGRNASFYGLPSFVWDAFVDGRKIPMRPATEISLLKTKPVVFVRVFSPAIRGEHLEVILENRLPPHDASSDDPVAMTCRFALSTTDELSKQLRGTHTSVVPPHIEIMASLPIPPGFVGREYDALVRHDRQWHLQLVGTETPQDKVVAIRTWAIALLMKEGLSFARALRALELVLESEMDYLDLSQEADRQARNRLLQRVPEAKACLRPR
jgi:hypothetical protein